MKTDTPARRNNLWLAIARPMAFLLGAVLSLLAIYSYLATVQMVIRDPTLVLPDDTVWAVEQLQTALVAMGLPVTFFAVYSLGLILVFSLTFMACGWLILLRRSHDWFGLYLGLMLLGWANGVGVFVSIPQASPWLATLYSYLSWFTWPGLFLLLYLFPSGHVTPHWTRWFAWIWGLFLVYGLVATILDILTDNFLYIFPLLVALLLVGGYAQIYRYRHAGALERQQVRVVVFTLVLFVGFFTSFTLIENLSGLGDPRQSGLTGALLYSLIFSTAGNLIFMSIPVSIAVAILRYRLWDIDIIIRRTLVYGGLTLTLALVYFGSVILLQSLVTAVGGQQTAVVTVISTLLIAALFTPLRRRIQRDIDRRFFRKKYDAEKIVAAFGASLREEVDLEDLQAQILAVVEETLQPEMVNLWIRSKERRITGGK
jgi:hypothetical protein